MDVSTLAAMGVLIGVQYTLGLSFFAWMLHGRRGTLHWALASLGMTGSGPVAALLFGSVPEYLVLLVFNALQYMGLALVWMGAIDFWGKRRSTAPVWLGLAAYLLWLSVFWFLGWGIRIRVIGYCLMSIAWSLAIALIFFRRLQPELRVSGRLVGSTFLLHAAFNVVRIFLPQEGRSIVEIFRPGLQGVSLSLEPIAVGGAMTFGLMAIPIQRLALELRRAGRSDSLTGLRNRRALLEDGGVAVENCRRQGTPCALLLLDLDHFKAVNDEHGHEAGDQALQHFAALVSGAIDQEQIFGRLGGEEFVVVLPGAGPAQARGAAERLRRLVADHPAPHGDLQLPLTVSIGLAWAQDEGLELRALLSRADGALYLAKDTGRDRILEAGVGPFTPGAPTARGRELRA